MKAKHSYKVILLIYAIFLYSFSLFAQGTWTAKANFLGTARNNAVAFSIGTKGYVGTGEDLGANFKNDFWEWDQPTNTWTQKANFPGVARKGAVAFSIGTKGYIGTGFVGAYLDDFYEWDQAANTWTQKANVGGGLRAWGVGFSIGTKGYIGTGATAVNDFWEWDQATNVWTQKMNFAGAGRYASAAFTVGVKGYVTTGVSVSGFPSTVAYYNDLWEWDPAGGIWTQKANFSGTVRGEATAFHIGKFGYVGTGTTNIGTGTISDFWKYDPQANLWSAIPNFGGGLREEAAAFNIGCYGYVFAGFINDQSGTCKLDLWEYYDPADTTCGCAVTASATGNTTICSGNPATLTASGGNTYSWNTGSTASSIVVTPTATASYTVVVASAPSCSDVATVTVTVAPPPVASVSSNQTICAGQAATLTASGGSSYSWSNGVTASSIIVSPTSTASYSVAVSNGPSCSSMAFATITVSTAPAPVISGNTSLCQGDQATLTASGGTSYSWNTGATTPVIIANPTSSASYTVVATTASGCTALSSVNVTVSPPPTASASGTTVCSGQTAVLAASGGSGYLWSNGATTSSINVITTAVSTYSVIVSIGSCSDTASASVGVSPNPSASTSANVTITQGQSATLGASGGGTYSWSNGTAGANSVVSPIITTQYCVFVTNAFGCSDSDCVLVTVLDIDCSFLKVGELFIPNAFSPDGDGENEHIKLLYGNYSCIDTYKFIIYNRWGEKVFESEDPNDEWDGTYHGKPEETAVFAWYLKAVLVSGEKIERKGNISLMR